ncbi:conserved hypothetical protein [Aspergillus terreus NIH2624]|uniref:AB hydrolase-1 domain-containing protein n=1 Tax=Aspergillus terreus (strain NIH 2624 / FGSC A1156) TaxID=341663 RepID=Q0CTB4_ASPTN|nr:uncharacterized protein ATEG_03070 [Aspergillus terreus NIH2624]EAU36344.1 conserved hypothetical protein [Aspergillus terreus NIH2624]
MTGALLKGLKAVFVFGYGLFSFAIYVLIGIRRGFFFKGTTEKERLELQLARNRFWNLSEKYAGLSHQILTLRNGFKFHYVCNETASDASTDSNKPLVIFIHGFPDSWAVWRNIVSSEALQENATIVAIDTPGYGGSDSLEKYTATNVLESLTEFIITLRANYGVDGESGPRKRKTIIVAHDWGCVLSMRLAAEAPELADRFILTNGPLVRHYFSNIQRLASSSFKMLKTSLRTPIQSRSTIFKAIKTLKPVVRQVGLSGYIFVMHLPLAYVRYLGSGGNFFFLKMAHKASYGSTPFTDRDAAECMASSIGPSIEECRTQTADGDEYPVALAKERAYANFEHMAKYYREGLALARWEKSVQTITDLHSISGGRELHRASSGAGIFDDGPKGALKAPATVLWGKQDIALDPRLCLDGISDYLVADSQVIELPRSGHFTPLEKESALALEKAVEWAVQGEKNDIVAVLQACYAGAVVKVRK